MPIFDSGDDSMTLYLKLAADLKIRFKEYRNILGNKRRPCNIIVLMNNGCFCRL